LVEGVKVSCRIRKDLFQTAFGDGNTGQLGNGLNRFQKWVLYGGLDQAALGRELAAKVYFVGSGVVEAGCKTVIGLRLKQSGMRWTVAHANAIIALRCCHLAVAGRSSGNNAPLDDPRLFHLRIWRTPLLPFQVQGFTVRKVPALFATRPERH